MTGECSCPIYCQGIVSVDKGSVIIRYKLTELIKKVFLRWKTTLAAMFEAWLGGEGGEPPAAMFEA